MKRFDCEVAIVGGGVAGLAAASHLAHAGKDVRVLEATNRCGGRILTVHEPLSPVAIEVGAEFVHGRSPEIWNLIHSAGLTAYEHSPQALHFDRRRMLAEKEVGETGGLGGEKAGRSKRRQDESFEDYLRRSRMKPSQKNWARLHIEGFNAAHSDVISVASLQIDARAAAKIDGDRAFHVLGGYDAIPAELLRSIPDHSSRIH